MFLTIDDLTVHCTIEGPDAAPPVLLLHSLGTSAHVWDPQATALARGRYRAIRPDLRGHGLTTVTPGPVGIARLAADALGVLNALGIAAAHVAGLSIGGRIALELAAMAPGRVLSLMLCDTALEFPPPSGWQARADAVRAGGMPAVADAVMERWVLDQARADSGGLRRMLLATPAEGYAAAAEALRDARADDLRGRVTAPTTILVGAADLSTPPSAAAAIRESIPGSRLLVIPAAAHIPTFEAAPAVTTALLDHLAACAPPPGAAAGMEVRKAVLGERHVMRAEGQLTPLDLPFRDFILEGVWGRVWTRPGLSRRDRSLLTLGMLAVAGHHDEFRLHVRATTNTGVTQEEIAEVLLQVAAYAGAPAANTALRIAKDTLHEMECGR